MRLIDADKFLSQIEDQYMEHDITREKYVDLSDRIMQQPTIEPEPYDEEANYWHEKANSYEQTLVKLAQNMAEQLERKKGDWVRTSIYNDTPVCSECYSEGRWDWDFCPNCGADMRGEQDE